MRHGLCSGLALLLCLRRGQACQSCRQSVTGLRAWIDFASLREALGQSNASLVALVMGFACVIAAIVTGFVFTATTLLDWQAVQFWRIEWLLGAVAMFAAGFLLKKK